MLSIEKCNNRDELKIFKYEMEKIRDSLSKEDVKSYEWICWAIGEVSWIIKNRIYDIMKNEW